MGISENNVSWESFCSEEVLQFRAACNQAIESSVRPIKRRVIRQIVDSSDARRLFQRTWETAGPEHFFQALSTDPSWHTVVNEELHDERAWSDLRDWEWFKKQSFEWIKSFLQKLVHRDHPVSRAATTLVVVLITLLGIDQIPPIHRKIAVALQPIVTVDGKTTTTDIKLPVNISLDPKSGNLPVFLNVSADARPTTLHFVSDPKTEVPLSFKVVPAGTPIPGTKDQPPNPLIIPVANLDMCGVKETLGEIATNLKSADLPLGALSSAFTKLAGVAGTYKDQQLKAANNLIRANSNRMLSIVLRENTRQEVILPYFDDTSGLSSNVVHITAHKIVPRKADSTVNVTVKGGAVAAGSPDTPLRQGDTFPLTPLHWSLIVNSIENRWPGKHMVQVFLVPELLEGSNAHPPKKDGATGNGTGAGSK